MINDINKILADEALTQYQLAKSNGNSELASHYYCKYLSYREAV